MTLVASLIAGVVLAVIASVGIVAAAPDKAQSHGVNVPYYGNR
jgi:hypothetical protein